MQRVLVAAAGATSAREKQPTVPTPGLISPWNTVFFKVEETIFGVPQHRFTEHSEIFADMFNLPQVGADHVEGMNKEHPITLSGHRAEDFHALVKVLYPEPNDVISGSYTLTKDEWVGVLNLSTRWQMKLMREHAIRKLSEIPLTSFEKVSLARDHKVAKWLKEGLNGILTQEDLNPDGIKSCLGLETAFRLMCIRTKSLKSPLTASSPRISLSSLGCHNCKTAMFTSSRRCHYCRRNISPNDTDAVQLSSLICDYSNTVVQIRVDLQNLRCKHCSNRPISCQDYSCSLCLLSTSHSNFWLISSSSPQSAASDGTVDEVFKEEIASYESWDQ